MLCAPAIRRHQLDRDGRKLNVDARRPHPRYRCRPPTLRHRPRPVGPPIWQRHAGARGVVDHHGSDPRWRHGRQWEIDIARCDRHRPGLLPKHRADHSAVLSVVHWCDLGRHRLTQHRGVRRRFQRRYAIHHQRKFILVSVHRGGHHRSQHVGNRARRSLEQHHRLVAPRPD